MTTFNLRCEAVETLLHEYVDETLDPWLRDSVEEHLSSCEACTTFARDLRNVTREAAALPGLLPESDIWRRVADRIGAPSTEAEDVPEPVVATPLPEPVLVAADAPIVLDERDSIEKEPLSTTEASATPRHLSFVTTEAVALTNMRSEPVVAESLPTVPLATPVRARREMSWTAGRIALAAAAVVLVTAVTSSLLTVRWLGPSRTPSVANDTRTPKLASSEKASRNRGSRSESAAPAQAPAIAGAGAAIRTVGPNLVALDSASPASFPPSAQLASAVAPPAPAADTTGSPEDVVYNKEIKALKRIVRRQKPDLDASTVAEIEQNLETLDSAIAQIRAALRKDPASPLLSGQASRTLEMKVELLRRAAMLQSST